MLNRTLKVFGFCLFLSHLQPSTTTDPLAQDIAAAVFIDQNKFYVGTSVANTENSITSVELSRVNGNLKANFISRTPSKGISVNGTSGKSSMYDQIINKLSAQKIIQTPIYVVATHNIPNEDNSTSLNSIALINFATKSEFTNTNKINDANGTELKNNNYAALTASQDYVFAAVPPSSGLFGEENSGIIRLKKGISATDGIKVQRLGGGQANNDEKAYKINLQSASTEKITFNSVNFATHGSGDALDFTLGTITDLCWDSKLNRLYVALTNATTAATTPKAGACSLLVGYIDNECLYLRTVIPLSVVQQSGIQSMMCYTTTNPNTKTVSTFNVKTMHTSTGKDYIIFVGDVIDSDNDKYLTTQINVYALPLTSGASDPKTNGMIASIRTDGTGYINFNLAVSNIQELMNKLLPNVNVGVSNTYLFHNKSSDQSAIDAAITDMQIIGDTVFISLAGDRGDPAGDTAGEAGIFSSTAIFNQNGAIRNWTPWTRAVCTASKTDSGVITDKVFGFGLDQNTSSGWYAVKNTKVGTVTLWGVGASNLHGDQTLSTVLLNQFFNDDFGIINLINFDDETHGFLSWDPSVEYPAFSMMVATGNNQVALIQTGARISSIFQPTTTYASDGDSPNVFKFNDSNLKIGTISCAEVSRSTKDGCGWLFVGGSTGLSVIRNDNDGSGWTELAGLTTSDFPGNGYSFKILTDSVGSKFANIIKLIANGTYLYVVTQNTLYSIQMNASDFYSGVVSKTNLRSTGLQTSLGLIFDAILIDNSSPSTPIFALATESGVKIATWNGTKVDIRSAQDTQPSPQDFLSGPAIKFSFISTQRGGNIVDGKADGNLYVTTFDQALSNLYVYRLDVQKTEDENRTVKLTLFNEPYKEPGFTQKYFYKIASFEKLEKKLCLKQVFDHCVDLHNFNNSLAITPDPNKFLPDSSGTFKAIDLGIKTNKIPLSGTLVQDTASGSNYIAGSFGMAVNE